MKFHRFYIKELKKTDTEKKITSKELLNQWLKVFRFKKGNELILFNEEFECVATIDKIENKEVTLKITKEIEKTADTKKDIFLFVSMPKKSNLELIFQKCTEIGVKNFIPIISSKTEKKDFNLERAEKIVIEAVEQSGQNKIPKIYNFIKLEELDLEKFNLEKSYVLDIEAKKININEVQKYNKIGLFIGPEGGWGEKDLAFFDKNKMKKISLGSQVLRAETAAFAISSLLLLQ